MSTNVSNYFVTSCLFFAIRHQIDHVDGTSWLKQPSFITVTLWSCLWSNECEIRDRKVLILLPKLLLCAVTRHFYCTSEIEGKMVEEIYNFWWKWSSCSVLINHCWFQEIVLNLSCCSVKRFAILFNQLGIKDFS